MGYRDEVAALEARREAIEAELADKGVLALAERLGEVESQLRERRLRVLDSLRVASPCDARWEAMEGEGSVRHCHLCDKSVYDLAGMTREEAIRLLSREGDPACMRLHRRRDGTVITADCLVGRQRRNGRALAGATTLSAAVFGLAASSSYDERYEPPVAPVGEVYTMGERKWMSRTDASTSACFSMARRHRPMRSPKTSPERPTTTHRSMAAE